MTSRPSAPLTRIAACLFAALGCGVPPALGDIAEGAARDDVIEALGEPLGSMTGGGVEMLWYARGTVALQDGVVVSSDVVSREAFERREAEQVQRAEEERERAEAARTKRLAAGAAELERMQNDETFAAKPATQRLDYWLNFRRRYPGINVSSQIREARSEAGANQQRMAKLDRQFQEGMRQPPIRTSSRKLRKFRRGRSQAAIKMRAEQLNQELFGDEGSD